MPLRTTPIVLAALALLLSAPAFAQRDTGGTQDPTVKPENDPHGAIKSMSQAADEKSKPDHSVTKVPNLGSDGSEAVKSGDR